MFWFLRADMSIDVPDFLDLNRFRATGLQAGEEELPDLSPPIVLPEDTRGTATSPPTRQVWVSLTNRSPPPSPNLPESITLYRTHTVADYVFYFLSGFFFLVIFWSSGFVPFDLTVERHGDRLRWTGKSFSNTYSFSPCPPGSPLGTYWIECLQRGFQNR